MSKTKPAPTKPEFTREDFFKALALSHLSSVCHDQSLMLVDAKGSIELESAFRDLHLQFHKDANKAFPVRPHDDFDRWSRGQAWLKNEGLK